MEGAGAGPERFDLLVGGNLLLTAQQQLKAVEGQGGVPDDRLPAGVEQDVLPVHPALEQGGEVGHQQGAVLRAAEVPGQGPPSGAGLAPQVEEHGGLRGQRPGAGGHPSGPVGIEHQGGEVLVPRPEELDHPLQGGVLAHIVKEEVEDPPVQLQAGAQVAGVGASLVAGGEEAGEDLPPPQPKAQQGLPQAGVAGEGAQAQLQGGQLAAAGLERGVPRPVGGLQLEGQGQVDAVALEGGEGKDPEEIVQGGRPAGLHRGLTAAAQPLLQPVGQPEVLLSGVGLGAAFQGGEPPVGQAQDGLEIGVGGRKGLRHGHHLSSVELRYRLLRRVATIWAISPRLRVALGLNL